MTSLALALVLAAVGQQAHILYCRGDSAVMTPCYDPPVTGEFRYRGYMWDGHVWRDTQTWQPLDDPEPHLGSRTPVTLEPSGAYALRNANVAIRVDSSGEEPMDVPAIKHTKKCGDLGCVLNAPCVIVGGRIGGPPSHK